jgi:phosphate transport system substrate-binding protein
MELIYAFSNKMPAGIVKNKSGSYIKPSIDSTSAAANLSIPDDTRTSITDTIVANGYPISGFTWILVYQEQNYSGRTREKASKLSKLLWWMVHQGQSYTKALHYAPLPDAAVKKAEKIIKSITYAGSPLL